MWSIFYHTKHNPGATWLVIRDTWENLRRTTLQEFFFWFPEGVFGEWHKGDKEFIWYPTTGLRGKVVFLGAEDEADASKVASMPLGGVAIDEPSPAAGDSGGVSEFIFDTALAQLRQPGMNWYAAKLAQNNPDETHWTYRRFWDPGTPGGLDRQLLPLQEKGFRAWQTKEPENLENLPPDYYESMAERWAHRPDLLRRFVEGKHGYQQIGKAITPEWSDDMHLSRVELKPIKGETLYLFWDGGLNPTCIICQISPAGKLLVLESHVGTEIGAFELIESVVKARLAGKYREFKDIVNIGDPNLVMREPSSSVQSVAKVIFEHTGEPLRQGPVDEGARIEPLRALLKRNDIVVDQKNAPHVWWALRGGWHRHITRTGIVGNIEKNEHSHPGDALGYGVARLFPMGKVRGQHKPVRAKTASYGAKAGGEPGSGLGFERPGAKLPKAAKKIG